MTHIYNKRSYSILGTYKFLWNYSKIFKSSSRINLNRAHPCCGRCMPRFSLPPFSKGRWQPGEVIETPWGGGPGMSPCWHRTNWMQQLGVPMGRFCCQARAEPPGHATASRKVTTLLPCSSPLLLTTDLYFICTSV